MIEKTAQLVINDERYSAAWLEKQVDRHALELEKLSGGVPILLGQGTTLVETVLSFFACQKVGYWFAPGATSADLRMLSDLQKNEVSGFALALKSSGSVMPSWHVLHSEQLSAMNEIAISANQLHEPANTRTAYACSSLSHIAGWMAHLLPGLAAGIETHLEEFSPFRFLKFMSQNSSVVTHLTPGQVRAVELTKAWRGFAFSDNSGVVVGSSEVHSEKVRTLLRKGAAWVQVNYGLTEVGPYVAGHRFHSVKEVEVREFPLLGSIYPASGFRSRVNPNSRTLELSHKILTHGEGFLDTGDCVEKNLGEYVFLGRRSETEDLLRLGLRPLQLIEEIQSALSLNEPGYLVMSAPGQSVEYVIKSGKRSISKRESIERFLKLRHPDLTFKIVPIAKIPLTENGKIKRIAISRV